MEEYPSRMTKEAMLEALGKAISDVKDEMSDIKQTIAKTDALNRVKQSLAQVSGTNIKDEFANELSSDKEPRFTVNDGVVKRAKPKAHRYDLLREKTKEDLIEVMNEYISKGWVPLGGVMLEEKQKPYPHTEYLQTIWLPEPPKADPLILKSQDRFKE